MTCDAKGCSSEFVKSIAVWPNTVTIGGRELALKECGGYGRMALYLCPLHFPILAEVAS